MATKDLEKRNWIWSLANRIRASRLQSGSSLKNYLYAVFLCSHNCCDCTRTYLYADLIFLPTVATKASYEASLAPSSPSLKEAQLSFNFQSFPRGQSPPLEKNYYSFSLYCLIQTASLFKNILGSLTKGGKNYKKNFKKNIIKSGTLIKKGKIS